MRHGEIQRINAAEIIGIDKMLASDDGRLWRTEIRTQRLS